MNLAEKIEQLAAHMRRKPRDHGATRKMAALLKKRDGVVRFDALLRLYYPASMMSNLAMRSPLLDSPEPDRRLTQLRTRKVLWP